MPPKHTLKKDHSSYFITMTVVDWIKVFKTAEDFEIILDSMKFYTKNRGLNIYAYVIMPNHIHMIVNADEGCVLHSVIRDFKRYTSTKIREKIELQGEEKLLSVFGEKAIKHFKKHNYKVWQDGNHAIELFTPNFTWTKVNYIHQNPVRAGLVQDPSDWVYSSFSNYQDHSSIFEDIHCLICPVLPN
ncbi:MAG: transposase [Crocinitomicaceae bacterium]